VVHDSSDVQYLHIQFYCYSQNAVGYAFGGVCVSVYLYVCASVCLSVLFVLKLLEAFTYKLQF